MSSGLFVTLMSFCAGVKKMQNGTARRSYLVLQGLAGELEARLERPELKRQAALVASGGDHHRELADERRDGGVLRARDEHLGGRDDGADAVQADHHGAVPCCDAAGGRVARVRRRRRVRVQGAKVARRQARPPHARTSSCLPTSSTVHVPARDTAPHSADGQRRGAVLVAADDAIGLDSGALSWHGWRSEAGPAAARWSSMYAHRTWGSVAGDTSEGTRRVYHRRNMTCFCLFQTESIPHRRSHGRRRVTLSFWI
jgi:hypothetical protein